jgi:hypothetical protein
MEIANRIITDSNEEVAEKKEIILTFNKTNLETTAVGIFTGFEWAIACASLLHAYAVLSTEDEFCEFKKEIDEHVLSMLEIDEYKKKKQEEV